MERFKDTDMSTLLDRAQYPYANKIEIGVGLTDVQAEAIVQMRLGQLTGLEREKSMATSPNNTPASATHRIFATFNAGTSGIAYWV